MNDVLRSNAQMGWFGWAVTFFFFFVVVVCLGFREKSHVEAILNPTPNQTKPKRFVAALLLHDLSGSHNMCCDGRCELLASLLVFLSRAKACCGALPLLSFCS